MSPDPDQEYFSDGLTEEIITDLSHIHDLLVISRNSAMTFKGIKKNTKEIAKEVNVQYVLEGSVRKVGNNLRITAQLIDADTDVHLWAKKYSGTLNDVFEVQEKVSQSIVNALKLKLSHEEKEKIIQHPIVDIRAYELYFKARQEIYKCTPESLRNALQLIENSMGIVGKNEMLLASQGYTQWMFFNGGVEPNEKHLQKTEHCAEEIFKLDPDSVHGYRLLGLAQIHRGKIKDGIQNLYRAIKKEPNDPDSLCWLGVMLSMMGKTKIALPLSKRVLQIDPQSSWNVMFRSVVLYYDRQFLEAANLAKPAYEKDTENPFFHCFYFIYLIAANEYDRAFDLMGESEKVVPDEFLIRLPYFLKYAIKNDKVKALEIANDNFKNAARNDLQYSTFLAEGYSLLDEKDEAINWLENAVDRGFIHYRFLNEYDPFLENIRGEERFKKLMKRVKKEWENFEV
jgi:TolB-like protein/lipoprotein NlpI